VTDAYLHVQNDAGVAETWIGARVFCCTGEMEPQDHPCVYLNMGEQSDIQCPYCATLYRFADQLHSSASILPDAGPIAHQVSVTEIREMSEIAIKANGPMIKWAAALECWTGGDGVSLAQGPPVLLESLSVLSQHRLLVRLGVAIMEEWGQLPTSVQRAVFQHATCEEGDEVVIKTEVARFLHDHAGHVATFPPAFDHLNSTRKE
jgi:uncharacterized Zn-finger protein